MGEPVDIDISVIRAAAGGDRAAFDEIWREYNPRLRRYLASLGMRDADDVMSQTWIEAFDRLGSVDDRPGGFRRLLFTIARRRMIDEIRRSSRRAEVEVANAIASHEDELVGTDAALELLATLPRAQAEVVALRVIVGLSASEVGEITGQSPGAVRVMGHRALQTLQGLLRPEDTEAHRSFDPHLVAE